MAFRVEKRALAIVSGLALMASEGFAQQEFRYEVWRGQSRVAHLPPHFKKVGNMGTLTVSPSEVAFEETGINGKKPKHPKSWRWAYEDIQQLKISPKSVTVLTYKDNAWKFGADREYEFNLVSGKTFTDAYELLRGRLDQRFVAAVPGIVDRPLWEIPAKRLVHFGGDEGVVQVGAAEIVYKSLRKDSSRTWRYEDIDNISSSGPFQLTITTFERAKLDYGSLKQFNFELKQRLDEARYNDLWLRLNQSKGLRVLNSYRQEGGGQQ